MKTNLIWVLIHIVGPITLFTIMAGLVSRVAKALFPKGHERAVTGLGDKIAAALSGGWHFFFLSAEDRHRLDVYETTGVDPGTSPDTTGDADGAQADIEPLDGDPGGTEVPPALLTSFAEFYQDPADVSQ